MQVNDIQGSPFQGDLTYRGFRASGLLGAGAGPVGLPRRRAHQRAVRRRRQLRTCCPSSRCRSISLVPGANPAFGLNTLGGAIAFTTSNGRSAPGVRAELGFGSFGRKRVDAELRPQRRRQRLAPVRRRQPRSTRTAGATTRAGDLGTRAGQARPQRRRHRVGRVAAGRPQHADRQRPGAGLHASTTTATRTPDLYAAPSRGHLHPPRPHDATAGPARVQPAARSSTTPADLRRWPTCAAPQRDTVNGDEADEAEARNAVAQHHRARARPATARRLSLARRSGDAPMAGRRHGRRQPRRASGRSSSRATSTPAAAWCPGRRGPPQLSAEVDGDATTLRPVRHRHLAVAPRTHLTGTRALQPLARQQPAHLARRRHRRARGAAARDLQLQQPQPGAGHRAAAWRDSADACSPTSRATPACPP